ncbi:hypothetical protein QQS21_000964 [Conoideocrella luteorostrata]|uniref:Uncharacterized protein n=1 Tax=Conoideocrella luteorostrata TaxID=1105319 RepID=A0AAJ0G281_9HYPO|nr:hypothetical protein QQS21_000964 [Conoideocrella luteorostrata]
MARFPFSISGRKKPTIELPADGPPMSKAHKILGSTPLSIDAPGGWDDALSSVTSDDGSPVASTSRLESESRRHEYDHQVVIANGEEGWDEDSDIMPHPLRLNAVNFPALTETEHTDTTGALRKSRSSSTIRSWYDKSKLPLSISQQTSSSAMARGLPTLEQLGRNPVIEDSAKARKKPPRLDLAQATRRETDAVGKSPNTTSGLDRMLRSPSVLSPFSPLSTRSRNSRKIQKRHTKEDIRSPVLETSQPGTSDSNRPGPDTLRDLPSLYDHYEQMSMRHVLRQSSTPGLQVAENGGPMLENVIEGLREEEDVHELAARRLGPAVPETPKTAVFVKPDSKLSPGGGARSISSRRTKTSKMSKSADRALEETDLLQTSVLVLSSDSEDDEIEQEPTAFQSPPSAPMKRTTITEDLAPFLAAARVKSSRGSIPSDQRNHTISRSRKQGIRTSVPTTNKHITIRSPEDRHTTPASIGPKSGTPYTNPLQTASSSRSSVTSDYSLNSTTTWQDEAGYGIQEARAITMLPARRPSDVEIETRETAPTNTSIIPKSPVPQRTSSTDQLTPPLSPTSVDFYIRSAHTSMDGPRSHSRLMAVTHQEEMLLSALRHKQQAMHQAPMSEAPEEVQQEGAVAKKVAEQENSALVDDKYNNAQSDIGDSSSEETQAKRHQSKGSQTTITGETFDFGFPAPPSFRESTSTQKKLGAEPMKLSIAPIQTSGLTLGGGVSLPSPSGPPPTLSLPKLPNGNGSVKSSSSRETASTQSQLDVPLFFDDTEPSPDLDDIRFWESATSPVAEPLGPEILRAVPWHESGYRQSSDKLATKSPKSGSPSFLHPHSFSRPNMKKQDFADDETRMTAADEDVPRPDSPISPDSFPIVPVKRTTRTNMARLSAVGPGFLYNAGEPGWWGDDG